MRARQHCLFTKSASAHRKLKRSHSSRDVPHVDLLYYTSITTFSSWLVDQMWKVLASESNEKNIFYGHLLFHSRAWPLVPSEQQPVQMKIHSPYANEAGQEGPAEMQINA